MPDPLRPEDDELAGYLIDELTAELDPDDARELAAELARMVEMGVLELDADQRVGRGPRADEVSRPWPFASRRPDRWCGSPAASSRGR
ncbi:MAG TPA: hypothetical protein VFG42_02515 [Baekduia sp.]|uniref:hypothetical protein n=1 Tax=Baekduia sp. TaxID=2600305 RepID=UPI002D773508|nr:hypothetical protein [Baekduia sp.]HET6505640.1 hypothetical protein [Baekduia sp.]